MDVINLHHLAVPCISKEKDVNFLPYQGDDLFYLNPLAIIRYEPSGAIVTPPMLYSSFLYVDDEVVELFRQRSFFGKGIPQNVISLLLENEVISDTPFFNEAYHEMQVTISGLPQQVLFEVTSFCNCDCIACYHHADLNDYVPPIDHLIKRINKLKNLGVGLFEVTGGEPFSRPDLYRVLNYIHHLGLHFYVVSNGEYIKDSSEELIEVLRKGFGVAVSLDGVGEVHDRIRRRPGLYDKMITGLDLLYARGIKIYFISTLSRESLRCVEGMIDVAKRYNTTIHFRPAIRTGAAVINNLEHIDLVQELGKLLQHPNVRNGLLNTKKAFPRSHYYGCGIRKRISVDSRGILYPCVMDRSHFHRNIDDYTEVSLVDELEKETKSFLAANDKCCKCSYNINGIRCGGFCRFSRSYQNNL